MGTCREVWEATPRNCLNFQTAIELRFNILDTLFDIFRPIDKDLAMELLNHSF